MSIEYTIVQVLCTLFFFLFVQVLCNLLFLSFCSFEVAKVWTKIAVVLRFTNSKCWNVGSLEL